MDITRMFFIASAFLCLALAVFANPLFDWTNMLTRKMGLNRLADFRERHRTPLLQIAQIVLVLTAILIFVIAWRLGR
jgi:uncharacterized membrane protein YbaN (DUF454 family)